MEKLIHEHLHIMLTVQFRTQEPEQAEKAQLVY